MNGTDHLLIVWVLLHTIDLDWAVCVYVCFVYLDGAMCVGALPAEVEEGENRHADGKPVDEANVVDERLNVGGCQVQQRGEPLNTDMTMLVDAWYSSEVNP